MFWKPLGGDEDEDYKITSIGLLLPRQKRDKGDDALPGAVPVPLMDSQAIRQSMDEEEERRRRTLKLVDAALTH